MLELLLGLWLLFGVIFYFIKSIPYIIQLAIFIVFFPALPFYVAHKNKKENPSISKLIYWLWGITYFLIFITLIFSYLN
jgi:hypothetical protein